MLGKIEAPPKLREIKEKALEMFKKCREEHGKYFTGSFSCINLKGFTTLCLQNHFLITRTELAKPTDP